MSQARPRSRRLQRPLLVLGLVALLVGGAAWLLWPTDPIGPRAFARIRLGMSPAEAKAVIGMPPRDTAPILDVHRGSLSLVASKGDFAEDRASSNVWDGDEFWIMVAFDDTGAVIGVSLWEVRSPKQPSFLDRLRTRIGL